MDGKKVDCGAEFEDGSFIWATDETGVGTHTVNIGVLYVKAQPIAYGFQRKDGISQVGFVFSIRRKPRVKCHVRLWSQVSHFNT